MDYTLFICFARFIIVSIVILILKHVLICETCLELVLLPNYIDLSYKTVKTAFKQNYILFTQHSLLGPCAGNISSTE